ncbi:hypothetical protein AB0I81_39960 [Nonomuraea sp. NPDC050404]|uniref:hypothetical protein n=1 Tax=Nonomuraea sp. NPDC050404 TaxID=3155783 RepID=UPI0033CC8C75
MDPCRYPNGATGNCGATPTRRYLPGHRCADHTPAALAGLPEPPETACPPRRCYCGQCEWWTPYNRFDVPSDTWTTDARAIASGKRRASPEMRAAAMAEVAEQRERRARLRKGGATPDQ